MSSAQAGSAVKADIAVVGAGAAGLYAALCAARDGATVALISATPLAQTASYWAQGGLAAALADDDSFELHLADTERAGRALVRRSAAEILVREAPACVHDLQALGVSFDGDRFGGLALGLEGGHTVRRVVHAGGSATGRRVVRQLSALVAAESRIAVLEGARARALWTDGDPAHPSDHPPADPPADPPTHPLANSSGHSRCRGLICDDGRIVTAPAVVLGTGGAAALWARTTNPPGSQGVGLLLAHAAGAALADLELLQFHPTAVIGLAGREGFLVTEAIRGEGATLHDASGERFVDELAPRDEVSRAIALRLQETGERSVGLDMRAIDPAHFPNVVASLREAGLDPARELIPVAPAAHYMMGGIVADLHARSTLPGLYAVGESSCTGLHGANRLASNSLSECFVFARRAILHALSQPAPSFTATSSREIESLQALPPIPGADARTRDALWRDAGIVRSAAGLRRLLDDPHPLARLLARSALERAESRGAHQRLDHPERDPALDQRHFVLAPDGSGAWQTWS
ncbi:MAG TPA: FAD-dependent oxidoreductase [Solirubrobacteraceae bacterium]